MESRGYCIGVGVGVQWSRGNWINKPCAPTQEEEDTDTYSIAGQKSKNVDELRVLHGLNEKHAT